MKASDLRVGNWVSKHGEYYQITSATIVSLERGESDAEPIPLTEEWLLKFGFKRHPNYSYWFCGRIILVIDNGVYFLCDVDMRIDIKYVHQLQNLYHALTGEELTHGK